MGKFEAYTEKTAPVAADLLILADSAALDGDGDMTTKKVQVGNLSLFRAIADPTVLVFVEDFLGGGTAALQVGTHGWNVVNGGGTALVGESNHPGIMQRHTTATNNTVSTMNARATPSIGTFAPADTFDLRWIFRLNSNDANTTLRIGAANDPSANPPVNGIYLEKLDADTNWFFVTRAASSQTRTATGVATGTGWVHLRTRRVDASTLAFSLNGGSETNVTATIPTAMLQPHVQIINSAASQKSVDLDFCSLIIPLTR